MADDYDRDDTRKILVGDKQPQITREMTQLSGAGESLLKSLQELAVKLEPILRSPNPEVDPGKETTEQALVGLGEAIRNERKGIQRSTRLVNDLLNRIEL